MKKKSISRVWVCLMAVVLVGMVCVPTANAFYLTFNTAPLNGGNFHGPPPREAWTLEPWGWNQYGNRDGTMDGLIDDQNPNNWLLDIQWSTGGTWAAPEWVFPGFGSDVVWFLSYDITLHCPANWQQAEIVMEINLLRTLPGPNQNAVQVDTHFEWWTDNDWTLDRFTGCIYLWDKSNPQYQHGTFYELDIVMVGVLLHQQPSNNIQVPLFSSSVYMISNMMPPP